MHVKNNQAKTDLESIEQAALLSANTAKTLKEIAAVRTDVLGKKGSLSVALRAVGKAPKEDRPALGIEINRVKEKIQHALTEAETRLNGEKQEEVLKTEYYDVTRPGRGVTFGAEHPLRMVEQEIVDALTPLGFAVATGPLVEHDWYNFEALNFPKDHPARDTQDTFFISESVLLRTHTSNVQIRTMLKQGPPVRILAPGMVFRNDEIDASHSPAFHQIEGLWVDEHATFADCKGVLRQLTTRLFGKASKIRFRPSFFPFTEPSAEVDVGCVVCKGTGGETSKCSLCKGTGWLEILGAGMVDPQVLQAVGYDPDRVQGFAFGVGLERIALLRWGIDDIRLFFENQLSFLRQFGAFG